VLKKIALGIIVLIALAWLGFYGLGVGWFASHEGPGEVTQQPIPAELVRARAETQSSAARGLGVAQPKQILFGDFHVHTTFSLDAFLLSLPLLSGEGSHPPADACDFARYCSALDFWSINDHAESLTPRHWNEMITSIRQCNAVSGDPMNPDSVAYLGWEWTQVGDTIDNHYGHKNVVLAHTDDEQIPTRPIAARRPMGLGSGLSGPNRRTRALFALATRDKRTVDFGLYGKELADTERCPDGVPVRELPPDCLESVATAGELYAKLNDWGHEAIVIPHGTTWGFYTPPGATWDKQLTAAQNDPDRQTLVEIHSGHGSSEEYREFRAALYDDQGNPSCPEPSGDYLPSCWQAGEIIRSRCEHDGETEQECEARAAEARQRHVELGVRGHLVIPGAEIEDWLDSGQCRDCFIPAFNYRPASSVQYMMALTNFDDPEDPKRFRFGFMSSSDVHTARPGTGYKEINRREMTEASGLAAGAPDILRGPPREPVAFSEEVDTTKVSPLQLLETERISSYFTTGGLIAVHSSGRDRGSIWEALERREIYGTSGGRTLLWFDLLNGPEGQELPMGSSVEMGQPPQFRVRALGSFEQKPGCPEYSIAALTPERLHHLCRDECYNPSDRRRQITRIEAIRIRPQSYPGESVGELIEDPWQIFECPPDPAGCEVSFVDPDYVAVARDTLYYARAIEEASPAVNGAGFRCRYDAEGACVEVDPCYGDEARTPYEDDCLAEIEERAWSSPIFVDYRQAEVPAAEPEEGEMQSE
jgi:hypothetical protein